MLIPSQRTAAETYGTSLSRRVNANSQQHHAVTAGFGKLIKKGEC